MNGPPLRTLPRPAANILHAEGEEGLRQLPTIGRSLAHSIAQLVDTGKLALLDRLRGASTPERIFATVAGIGPELAERIHEHLAIESLTELESAAYSAFSDRADPSNGTRIFLKITISYSIS